MQEGVNAQGIYRQVRATLSVTPNSCVYAINALRMSECLSEYLMSYKNIYLSLELRAPCSSADLSSMLRCSSRLLDLSSAQLEPSFSGEPALLIYPPGQ